MAAYQAPPSLGFSRQEHWSGSPFPSPMHESEKWKWSHSVVSDCSWPRGLQPTRLLRPWDFPGKSTGVGCHCLLHIRTWLQAKPLLWHMDLCPQSNVSAFLLLSGFVIAILSRSKHLLISWLQSLSTVILEPRKIKSVTVSAFSPSICHEMMGLGALILVSWMLSFKPAFSLFSLILIKRLFGSSSLSAIRVVSFAYLRLLIFLPAILIPACDSFSLAFHMMYSAQKLNKQGDNIQPWCTPFPILNQFIVSCLILWLLDLHTGFFADR